MSWVCTEAVERPITTFEVLHLLWRRPSFQAVRALMKDAGGVSNFQTKDSQSFSAPGLQSRAYRGHSAKPERQQKKSFDSYRPFSTGYQHSTCTRSAYFHLFFFSPILLYHVVDTGWQLDTNRDRFFENIPNHVNIYSYCTKKRKRQRDGNLKKENKSFPHINNKYTGGEFLRGSFLVATDDVSVRWATEDHHGGPGNIITHHMWLKPLPTGALVVRDRARLSNGRPTRSSRAISRHRRRGCRTTAAQLPLRTRRVKGESGCMGGR